MTRQRASVGYRVLFRSFDDKEQLKRRIHCPAIIRFWPTIKLASALHKNAHALPNSSGVPKRPGRHFRLARLGKRFEILAGVGREPA